MIKIIGSGIPFIRGEYVPKRARNNIPYLALRKSGVLFLARSLDKEVTYEVRGSAK